MTTILSRSNWTSTRAGGSPFNWGRIRGLVCHYPAAGRDIGVISKSQEESRIRGWRNYHVNGRGWADLGYNYVVTQAGRIYTGRGNRVGAHCAGHNSTTVGVLFMVGDNEPLTAAAKKAFKSLRAYLRKKGAGSGVWGHQQMSGASTRCPGPYIMADIRDGSLKAGTGGGAAKPGSGGSSGGKTYTVVGPDAPLGLYDKDGDGRTRVRDWQADALGYDEDDADGYFGPTTETDTKDLQRKLGVDDDGLVGNDTLAAWEKAGNPKLEKSKPSKPKVPGKKYAFPFSEPGAYIGPKSGPNRSHSGLTGRKSKGVADSTWIKRFVNQLEARGWDPEGDYLVRFGNDGKYGDELESLIRAFQKDQGLPIDGLAGRDTWDAAFTNPVT